MEGDCIGRRVFLALDMRFVPDKIVVMVTHAIHCSDMKYWDFLTDINHKLYQVFRSTIQIVSRFWHIFLWFIFNSKKKLDYEESEIDQMQSFCQIDYISFLINKKESDVHSQNYQHTYIMSTC